MFLRFSSDADVQDVAPLVKLTPLVFALTNNVPVPAFTICGAPFVPLSLKIRKS